MSKLNKLPELRGLTSTEALVILTNHTIEQHTTIDDLEKKVEWLEFGKAEQANLIQSLEAKVKDLELDAMRWRFYANSPQTALVLGTKLHPCSEQDWKSECDRLADDIATKFKKKEGNCE